MHHENLRILIVDDDKEPTPEDLIALLRKAGPERLTGETWTGLEIVHVTNQIDADNAIAKKQFHIILLDLLYPKKIESGMKLPLELENVPKDDQGETIFQGIIWLPELRRLSKKSAIIVLTSYADERHLGLAVETIRNRYANEFVPKTAGFEIIAARIAIAWRYEQQEVQHQALEAELRNLIRTRATRIYAEDLGVLINEVNSKMNAIARRIDGGDPSAVSDSPALIRNEMTSFKIQFQKLSEYLNEGKDNIGKEDLAQLVNQLLNLYRCVAEQENVELPDNLSNEPIEVMTFSGDLKVAMYEVLINAIDSAKKRSLANEQGEVKVQLEYKGDWVLIRFMDNGPGFPQEILADPFKRRCRVEDDGSKKGMGLYIAQRMMHAIGGDIQIQNQSKTGGGEVILTVRNLGIKK
ncbi:MAG: ATP-binding protein [Anaerolineales bacterium]|nr:ATP-binding protein [Anaerolineales bacterium]